MTLLTSRCAHLSRRQGATLFMVLHAGFTVLQHRYTGETDLSVGVPVAGRSQRELEDVIGFFVNTLPLRQGIDPSATISELLQGTRERVLQGLSHRMIPLDRQELEPRQRLPLALEVLDGLKR